MKRAGARLTLGFFCVIASLTIYLSASRQSPQLSRVPDSRELAGSNGFVLTEPYYSGLILALVAIGLGGLIQIALGVLDVVQFRWACDRITKTFAKFGPVAATTTLGLRSSRMRDSTKSFPPDACHKDGHFNEDALSAVIAELTNPFVEIRLWACEVLEGLGAQAAPAVQALIAALSDKNLAMRRQTIESLRAIGEASSPAVPALIAIWAKLWKPREEAEKAICEVGPLGQLHFVEALVDTRAFVRKAAAQRLAGGNDPGLYTQSLNHFESVIVRSLLQASKDRDERIRVIACRRLGQILATINPGGRSQSSRGDNIRDGFRFRTHGFYSSHPLWNEFYQKSARVLATADSVLDALLQACSDSKPSVRSKAVEFLGYARRSKTVESAVLLACDDESSEVRESAVNSIYGAVESPIPHLINALSDKTEGVRRSAVFSLGEACPRENGTEVVFALLKCRKEGRVGESEVLTALGQIGPAAMASVPFLTRRLSDMDSVWNRHWIEDHLVGTLGRIGAGAEPAVPTLVGLLRERSKSTDSVGLSRTKVHSGCFSAHLTSAGGISGRQSPSQTNSRRTGVFASSRRSG